MTGHPGGNWTADFVVVTPSNGFAAAASFSTGLSRSAQMATADFNGDGIPDLAVTDNSPNGGVAILLGDGNGGFSARNRLSVRRLEPLRNRSR